MWSADTPVPLQIRLQEVASAYMQGLQAFNCKLLFLVVVIVSLVGWLMCATLETTLEFFHSQSDYQFTHESSLEIGWTSVPAIVLLILSSPSFSLLFSMDEVSQPEMTLKVYGHQWYWSYEMSDFNSCMIKKNLRYTAYMTTTESILASGVKGLLRNLETSRRVLLPIKTHLRLLITSVDVLHSWAVPSLGIKVDACPGRLNSISLFIKRFGLFFGQCSEICGVNHGFMPIAVTAVSSLRFHTTVMYLDQ